MNREQGIQGDFTQDSLPSLLQYLGVLKSTGQLQIRSSFMQAALAFRDGQVVDAAMQGSGGQEALFRALSLRGGTFQFHPGDIGQATTITVPLERLLLDAAFWQDTQDGPPEPINPKLIPVFTRQGAPVEMNFSSLHWRVIAHVDGVRTIEEIGLQARVEPNQLELVVYELAKLGILELQERRITPLDPAFLEAIRECLTVVIGPIARVIMRDTAEALGVTLETLEASHAAPFTTNLTGRLSPGKQERFRALVQPVMHRYVS